MMLVFFFGGGGAVDVTIRDDLLHVELGATSGARSVERNHLGPQQVLSRGDTGWDGDCVYAAVVDDLGGSPVASVVAVLLNLEPGRALCQLDRSYVCRLPPADLN